MMKVIDYKEQKDGSAIVTFETTLEEREFLVGHAILDILQKQMKRIIDDEGIICSTVSD